MLQQQILDKHSKAQKDIIVLWVGTNQQRFKELVLLLLNGEKLITQRAGWPLSDVAISHP